MVDKGALTQKEQDMRETILRAVEDLAVSLLKEDRKGDEDLPLGVIEKVLTEPRIMVVSELVVAFEMQLREMIPYAFEKGTAFDATEVLPVLEGRVVS